MAAFIRAAQIAVTVLLMALWAIGTAFEYGATRLAALQKVLSNKLVGRNE